MGWCSQWPPVRSAATEGAATRRRVDAEIPAGEPEHLPALHGARRRERRALKRGRLPRHQRAPRRALPGGAKAHPDALLRRGRVVRRLAPLRLHAHLRRLGALADEAPAGAGNEAVLGVRLGVFEPAPRPLDTELEGKPRRDPLCEMPPRRSSRPVSESPSPSLGVAMQRSSNTENAYHNALMVRRGYERAIEATAHKLLREPYVVLRNARPYHNPEADYEELLVRRNAPRWIRMLHYYCLIEHAPAASAGT